MTAYGRKPTFNNRVVLLELFLDDTNKTHDRYDLISMLRKI